MQIRLKLLAKYLFNPSSVTTLTWTAISFYLMMGLSWSQVTQTNQIFQTNQASQAPQGAASTVKIGEINSYKAQPAFLIPYKKGMELAESV